MSSIILHCYHSQALQRLPFHRPLGNPVQPMFSLTVSVPSALHGTLSVVANVEPGRYEVEGVKSPAGHPVACTPELLDEIETSIEFEIQCAKYEALFFDCEDPALIALYS